jgi:signal transduction histidine kinase
MDETAAPAAAAPAAGGRPAPRWVQVVYQLLVVVPTVTYLVVSLAREVDPVLQTSVLLFLIAVAVVDLIPVPGWGGLQLSLSFPLLLGVAIVFPPPVATLIAFLGSVDPREFRLEVSPLKALFNRSQMALSILAASLLFDLVADQDSVWYVLLLGVVLAASAAYVINAGLVARLEAFARGLTVRQVLVRMHGSAPYEFLLSYIGLGLFGAVIAQFYLSEGFWSVVVFLGPLVFARQMYFRSRALADRLAEQNETLADQARRLEELLEKEHHTVDELRELNRMKGEFVAVVSHELRTPVTALMGYAKTLRQPEFANDPQMRAEFLERMERQSDRLLRLVENLLTASNLENNRLPITIGRVLFEDLVREVIEGLATEASRVQVNIPDDLPVLTTDRQVLSRVLQNLVDNALKYSPDGSPCEIEARGEPEHLVFWVRDYGIGIPPDEQPRIFDRFYQVDSSSTRTFRGAGLGLSLVQDLLEHLGGTIEVDSTPGEGSRFTVTLPIRHPQVPPPESQSGPAPGDLLTRG